MGKAIFSTEKRLEAFLSTVLNERGWQSWHNEPVTTPGIPDRYVAGGTFIEVKCVKTFNACIESLNRQRTFMDRIAKGGDDVWVCALVGELLYFEPWRVWTKREQFEEMRERPFMSYSPLKIANPKQALSAIEQGLAIFRKPGKGFMEAHPNAF